MMMAPQQRQSLEILHLPVMELRALIQKEMAENPAIEDVVDPAEQLYDDVPRGPGAETKTEPLQTPEEDGDGEEFDREFEALREIDEDWRDYFLSGMENANDAEERQEKREFWLNSIVAPVSMHETLASQLELMEFAPRERALAETIVMNLDADGYFRGDLPGLAEEAGLTPAQGEKVLAAVQTLEPAGIAARDLREALLLQLARQEDSAETRLAREIVSEHLHELAAHKRKAIATALNVTADVLEEAVARIQKLDPRPGAQLAAEKTEYVEPEVEVVRAGGAWQVKVDDTFLPRIRISRHYRKMLDDPAVDDKAKSYIRERIRAGLALQKSLFQRQSTIVRIASEIVAAQQEFLDHGPSRLRPMTLGDIARRVGVHETTVCRAVGNKYIRTPRGVIELKYFFTPGVATSDGGVVSNRAVQERIAALIAAEDPENPLSDLDLQKKLDDEGFRVARRTVAKYRMNLKLPASQFRKR